MNQRIYWVVYSRKLGGQDKRITVSMLISEDSLKQILCDTKSVFAYKVKSAILIEA